MKTHSGEINRTHLVCENDSLIYFAAFEAI